MTKWKIGVSLDSFRGTFRESLTQASRMGARGVQIIPHGDLAPEKLSETGIRSLRRLLETFDLVVASVAFPTRRGYDVATQLEERIAATKRALTLSYQLKAPIVTNRIGPVSDDPEHVGRVLQSAALEKIGRHAEHVGAVFAITPGSEPPERLKSFLQNTVSAGLGVNYDPAAVILGGFDAVEGVRQLGPWLRHLDARDAAAGTSPDQARAVALGRGSLDWDGYVGALEEFDYHGWCVIQPSGGHDQEGDAARAVKFLESF